jgi:hypothetical protein
MLEGTKLRRLRNQAQESRNFQIKDFSPYEAIYLFDPEKSTFPKEPGPGIAWDKPPIALGNSKNPFRQA